MTTVAALDRVVYVQCSACAGYIRVEFAPPDAPDVTARIEYLSDQPDDAAPFDAA